MPVARELVEVLGHDAWHCKPTRAAHSDWEASPCPSVYSVIIIIITASTYYKCISKRELSATIHSSGDNRIVPYPSQISDPQNNGTFLIYHFNVLDPRSHCWWWYCVTQWPNSSRVTLERDLEVKVATFLVNSNFRLRTIPLKCSLKLTSSTGNTHYEWQQ